MTLPKISIGRSERVYISDIPLGDEGNEYIYSLFEKVYSLTEGVVVWLWSSLDAEIFFSQIECLKNKLNYFRAVEAKKTFYPVQFMFSYKFDSREVIEKKDLINLLVLAWFGYDRPEIYFLADSKYFEEKANIIMNRESRNLSLEDSISVMPNIHFYRDGFEEEAWMKNDSGIPLDIIFSNIHE